MNGPINCELSTPNRRDTLWAVIRGWFPRRHRSLVARAGDVVSMSFSGGEQAGIRRGDFISISPGGERPWAVWKVENGTVTVARGWRLRYLRYIYNPGRRFLRFCRNAFVLMFERPSSHTERN